MAALDQVEALMAALDAYDGDVFLYYGDIVREGYHAISEAFEQKGKKGQKACIVLITYGGDADAAYRIARAANHHYKKAVEILIPDVCKSAGTLLCIGACKLIFGDRGELGPLDIQLSKPDELFERMSGLDIVQALNALQNQILESFRTYLVDIRGGSGIRTKMAADIAAKLAGSFVTPIAAKIDPITLGAHQRAMSIAYDYGERLNEMVGSLKKNSLEKLLSNYPSHGFVIDRKEAASLFKNVEAPDGSTIEIYQCARRFIEATPYPDAPLIVDLAKVFAEDCQPKQKGNNDETNNFDDQRIKEKVSGIDGDTEPESREDEPIDVQSVETGDHARVASGGKAR